MEIGIDGQQEKPQLCKLHEFKFTNEMALSMPAKAVYKCKLCGKLEYVEIKIKN